MHKIKNNNFSKRNCAMCFMYLWAEFSIFVEINE